MILQTSMIMFHVNLPGCSTPRKFNMEPKNEGLEDVFPFQKRDF